MPSIEFFVPGNPTPKQSVNKGKKSFYTDPKAKNYEGIVRDFAHQAMEKAALKIAEDAVTIHVICYRPIPKKFSQKRTKLALEGIQKPITRPDTQNFLKGVYDGMNQIVYQDDAQITDEFVSKRYSDRIGVLVRAEWEF